MNQALDAEPGLSSPNVDMPISRPLVAVIAGSMAVAEVAREGSLLQYIAGGVAAAGTIALVARFERAENNQ
jgi:hypothetical protein